MSEPPPQEPGRNDVTLLLEALHRGDSNAAEKLLAQVYHELRVLAARKMSREACGHTLQPTALVHEAWLRLAGGTATWENRAHFFGAAAEAMRRILVDRARHRNALCRGGRVEHVGLDHLEIASPGADEEVLAINEALDALAAHDSRKAELIKLRYFTGFTIEQAAELLGISAPTAKRDWRYARAWLYREMTGTGNDDSREEKG
jgi:RNA polymerase sigma factor (TIGR02999 family)